MDCWLSPGNDMDPSQNCTGNGLRRANNAVKRPRHSSSDTTAPSSSEEDAPTPRLRRKASSQRALNVLDAHEWEDEAEGGGGDSDDDSEYEESEDSSSDEEDDQSAKKIDTSSNCRGEKRSCRPQPVRSENSRESGAGTGRGSPASPAIDVPSLPPQDQQQSQQREQPRQQRPEQPVPLSSSVLTHKLDRNGGAGGIAKGPTKSSSAEVSKTEVQVPATRAQKASKPARVRCRGGASWVGSANATPSGWKKKEHKCQHCGKVFAKPCKLSRHVATHTGEKPFECKEPGCGKAFATKDKLTRHGISHARKVLQPASDAKVPGSRVYRASGQPASNAASSTSATVKAGGKNTNGVKHEHSDASMSLRHACMECGKGFLDNYHLKRHMKALHEGPKPFKCEFTTGWRAESGGKGERVREGAEMCGAAFSKKWQLREHLAKEHGSAKSNSRMCRCTHPDCDRAFDRPSKLAAHEKTHKPRFFCEFESCGKGFVLASGLNLHLRDEHPFRCSVCDRRFDREDKMQEHQSTHARAGDGGLVRPYLCSTLGCGKAFTEKRNLNAHRRTAHTEGGRKRFRCEESGCDFAFAHRHTLVKHMKREHSSPPKKKAKTRTASRVSEKATSSSSGKVAADLTAPESLLIAASSLVAADREGAIADGIATTNGAAATGVNDQGAHTASKASLPSVLERRGSRAGSGASLPRSRSAAELSSSATVSARRKAVGDSEEAALRISVKGQQEGETVRSGSNALSSAVTKPSTSAEANGARNAKEGGKPKVTQTLKRSAGLQGDAVEGTKAASLGEAPSKVGSLVFSDDILRKKSRLVKNFAGNFGGSGGASLAAAGRRPRSSSM